MARFPYSVNFYGSHPKLDNDDCWVGEDYATLEDARKAFDTGHLCVGTCTCKRGRAGRQDAFIELVGPTADVYAVRANPLFVPRRKSVDREWQQEIAMQAGMAGGCDAYNDAMGY